MDENIKARKQRIDETKKLRVGGLELSLLRICQFLAFIGGIILLILTVMTVYSIIGRSLVKSDHMLPIRFFSQELFSIPLQFLSWWRPVKGDFELIEIGTAIAIFSFLPYCQMVRGNVLVDFFTNKAHPRVKASMDVLANALFTAITAAFTWRMAIQSQEMITASWKQSSMILKIPSWWGVLAATCFMAFLTLVCLYTFIRSIREASGHKVAEQAEELAI